MTHDIITQTANKASVSHNYLLRNSWEVKMGGGGMFQLQNYMAQV